MGVGAPSGTVTFLFTDIEGSTLLWQEAPDAMREALELHDSILRAAIDGHGGYVFSTGGDGFGVAFARSGDALAAAAEGQAGLAGESWPEGAEIRVRMGVHTGEVAEREGDYFGTPVNQTARLMAAGHGGQVLVSAVTASVAGRDGLVDLGIHRLRDLAEAQQVFQLGDGSFPALRSLDTAVTNLAVQPTALVGRQGLIADLAAVVEREPLVTLTGVGGVGKTRLAVEVGAEVLPRFPDGVWVVELAPVTHDEFVLQSIAEVLGIAAQTGEPLATTIVSRLKTKRLLVIVDNCEHVLTPVARLADRLVSGAPGVRVLATSREPLGIGAERVRAVPPLAEGTEAVELFVDRATRAGADLDDSQIPAVAEICARLDGIPLAIELAAARARMMAPAQIAERLDQRFRLLTGGGRTAVERHRTLQATVAWSYGLLDEIEQVVFQRLSTLVGSFDLDAAEAITAGGPVEGFEVLDALGRLVDKSMVLTVAGPAGASVRYRLLETLRQFGADRLSERDDGPEVQDRHALYWRDRAVDLGRDAGGTDQTAALDAIDVDIDNYRAAFAHLLSVGQVNEAARGIIALDVYWQIRRTREGLPWYQQLIAHSDLDPRWRPRALAQAAQTEANIGDFVAAERDATEAVELTDALGIAAPLPALQALMLIASCREDHEADRAWYERAHEVAVVSGQPYLRLLIEAQRRPIPGVEDIAETVEHCERLLPDIEEQGSPLLASLAALQFAVCLYDDGQIERASAVLISALESARRSGPIMIAAILGSTAAFNILTGKLDHARAPAAEALRLARDEGLTMAALDCIVVVAALAARQGEIDTAATLLAGGSRYGDALGSRGFYAPCRAEATSTVEAHTGDLGAARGLGTRMTFEDLANLALATLGDPLTSRAGE